MSRKIFICGDCDKDVWDEQYMVHHELWNTHVNNKECMLCVDCLERRIGRELNNKDFIPDIYINQDSSTFPKRGKLLERMSIV